MRALVLLAVVVAGLSGCASSPGGPPVDPPSTLPLNWNDGVELHAFEVFARHSGARGAELNSSTLGRPSTCQAYRGEAHLPADSCVVRDPQEWERPGQIYGAVGVGTWVVEADWAGCPGGDFQGCNGNPQPGTEQQRVVAFDAGGRAIAWWDGRTSPDTQFITE